MPVMKIAQLPKQMQRQAKCNKAKIRAGTKREEQNENFEACRRRLSRQKDRWAMRKQAWTELRHDRVPGIALAAPLRCL